MDNVRVETVSLDVEDDAFHGCSPVTIK